MSKLAKQSFLDDMIQLLVRQFGVTKVRSSLALIDKDSASKQSMTRSHASKTRPAAPPSIASALDATREHDEQKYHALTKFYARLNARATLPQSQDIYHFAQLIGMKNIHGKSRKDLIPKLMRFLIDLPNEQLQMNLRNAEDISESQRQRGFSVLTDKLLGEKS